MNVRNEGDNGAMDQFDSYLGRGIMSKGMSLVAPNQNWMCGTDTHPRRPWNWREDPARHCDEPVMLANLDHKIFKDLHDLFLFAERQQQLHFKGVIPYDREIPLGGTSHTLRPDAKPFSHPYYWAGIDLIKAAQTFHPSSSRT